MRPLLISLTLLTCALPAQQHPTTETAAWWATTTVLADDSMQGRDTGTEAYERAAKYVAERFSAAGLKPAGDAGTFFQRVGMHQVALDTAGSSVAVVGAGGGVTPLALLEQVTVTVLRDGTPLAKGGPMVFVGYGDPAEATKDRLRGRVAVFFNNTPAGLPAEEKASFAARRQRVLAEAQPLAIVSIDNPAAIEPTHWPAAYARTVTLAGAGSSSPLGPVTLRLSAEAAPLLFAGSSVDWQKLLPRAERGEPLTMAELPSSLRLRVATTSKEIASPNVLAVLPGTDAALAPEYVALSAHLDGYGFGMPVLGDNLYNGTLDDAAYVALLIEVAKNLHAKAPARSLLFCVFTGEEKGLLGSAYFTAHPTVPMAMVVADLNLDQLRPIFPLKILTMEGIADSTLGTTARQVAAGFGIELRPDREPERNLFRRADNYNFVRAGIPIVGFIFGYNSGSPEEVIYRDWYARRYHKPQDDLATPIDWKAAATFNRFYEQLAVTLANAPERPAWLAGSAYAPKVVPREGK